MGVKATFFTLINLQLKMLLYKIGNVKTKFSWKWSLIGKRRATFVDALFEYVVSVWIGSIQIGQYHPVLCVVWVYTSSLSVKQVWVWVWVWENNIGIYNWWKLGRVKKLIVFESIRIYQYYLTAAVLLSVGWILCCSFSWSL